MSNKLSAYDVLDKIKGLIQDKKEIDIDVLSSKCAEYIEASKEDEFVLQKSIISLSSSIQALDSLQSEIHYMFKHAELEN